MSGGIRVTLNASGLSELQKRLAAMEARSIATAPLMRALGVAAIKIVHDNFDAGGRPQWKPLSAKTIAAYQAQAVKKAQSTQKWKNAKSAATRRKIEDERVTKDVDGHKILMQTGELRQSIMLGEVTESSVTIGSSIPYSRIQQQGGTIGPIVVKPRNKMALAIPTENGLIFRRYASIPERQIPARPYLTIPDEELPMLGRMVAMYLTEGVVR